MSYHPHRIPASPQDQHHYSMQQTQPQTPIQQGTTAVEIVTATRCTACGLGLVPLDLAYQSLDALFCITCPRPINSAQVTLVACEALPKYKPSVLSGCSACWKDLKKGQMIWRCKKCWDKTLCERCWKKTKRHCKHVSSGEVVMMRVVDGDEDDDDDSDGKDSEDDDDGLENVIAAIASIVT